MTLRVMSPLQGWAAPLAELPDAAFAEGMVGEGVAIDPLGGTLHAPCDGMVIGIHRAHHAVTLRSDEGVDILCHIGIETVGLDGRGFTVHVAQGDRVGAGARLLDFDLDTLAAGAKSLASPILVIDTERFTVTARATDRRIAVGDWLMDVEPTATDETHQAVSEDGPVRTREVTLPAGHGIHARPAAAIVACARRFNAEVELVTPRARAPASSAVALMTLGAAGGERLTLHARGAEAEAALDALERLIATGLEGDGVSAPVALSSENVPQQSGRAAAGRGVTAVPGIAIGTIVRMEAARHDPPELGEGIAAETRKLDAAIAEVGAALADRAMSGPAPQRAIVEAHRSWLGDPRLRQAAAAAIADGASAGSAWRIALAPDIAALQKVSDARIAGRVDDLRDLEQQVIAATLDPDGTLSMLPADAILIAQELLPSQLMALDPARLSGIALAAGGPTSHVAIIAAARGVPMAVAMGPDILGMTDGTRAVLDADAGTLVIADADIESAACAKRDQAIVRRNAALTEAHALCHLADGTRIEIFANLGSLDDADAAIAAGAEGSGLLRTELLFLDRETPPDEDEQFALYSAIAARLEGRPLVIRTLDIGGDKQAPYLHIGHEENPALGLRGIRVGLTRSDLLMTQLRAILRVSPATQCRILLPMIASMDELVRVRRFADDAAGAVGRTAPVEIGVMIETPAAAITADLLATVADFFAIGTNDLSQYTLAMDRGNPAVAADVDPLHPAVLRMIAEAARAGKAHSRPVGVCGGLASDLIAAPILLGLGVTELSAVPGIIPELKALVRSLALDDCVRLAAAALVQHSAAAVRALAAEHRS